jgi:hypothetical protein
MAVDDSDLESRDDTRNLTAGFVTVARQSDESAFDISLDICAVVGDVDLEIDISSSVVQGGKPKEDSHTTDKLQTCTRDESTAITAVASWLLERSEQVAEVLDGNQEYEIHDIVGKEDVDDVVHYLVE